MSVASSPVTCASASDLSAQHPAFPIGGEHHAIAAEHMREIICLSLRARGTLPPDAVPAALQALHDLDRLLAA